MPASRHTAGHARGPLVEETPGVAYAELLATTRSTFGPLADTLAERNERRGMHLFLLLTNLLPFFEGLSQQREALLWLARRTGIDDDIASLLREAAQQVVSGVESMLAEPDPRALDEARFLMEIEFLFRDFARSPERLEVWRRLPEDQRRQQFGFTALRRREEQLLGVGENHVLFDQEEYRFHGQQMHPLPESYRRGMPAPDEVTGLFRDAGDLLHHASRVWAAGLGLAATTRSGGGHWTDPEWPPLDAVDEARRMIDEHNRTVGLPTT